MKPSERRRANFRPRSLLLVAAVVCAASVSAQGLKWTPVANGLAVTTATFAHRAPIQSFTVTAIRAETSRYRVRVIDVGRLLKSQSSQVQQSYYGAPSLRVLDGRLRPVVAMNGGFITSYAFPRPVGLARSKGVTFAPVAESKFMSGVLCVSRAEAVAILSTSAYSDNACREALQSGPVIVEATGKVGIRSTEPANRAFIRTAVCTDRHKRVLFLYAGATALFDFAQVLARPEGNGGFDCTAALNLSGDSDAGMLWRVGKEQKTIGSLDASLATALILEKR